MLTALVAGFIAISLTSGAPLEATVCDPIPDEILGLPLYTALSCHGQQAMESEDYEAAVSFFEKAAAVDIHEAPNFRSLDDLAIAYAKYGQHDLAVEALRRYEVSLLIYFRSIECKAVGDTRAPFWGHEWSEGDDATVIDDPLIIDVAREMCGEVEQELYERHSIERWRDAGGLVDDYYKAKAVVDELAP